MFDEFRNALNDENTEPQEDKSAVSPFTFPEGSELEEMDAADRPRRTVRRMAVPREVLGMTPFQSFVIAVLLFLSVLTIGSFFLLITGKIMFF